MSFVIVESPYAPKHPDPERAAVELARNLAYVRAAMADCFRRDEVPFASHALYTQPGVLDDTVPAQRKQGIEAGFWIAKAFSSAYPNACLSAFYVDRGESSGMKLGRTHAYDLGLPAVDRRLGSSWSLDADEDWALDAAGQLFKRRFAEVVRP